MLGCRAPPLDERGVSRLEGANGRRLYVLSACREEACRSRRARRAREHGGNKLARSPGHGIRQATQNALLISSGWEAEYAALSRSQNVRNYTRLVS